MNSLKAKIKQYLAYEGVKITPDLYVEPAIINNLKIRFDSLFSDFDKYSLEDYTFALWELIAESDNSEDKLETILKEKENGLLKAKNEALELLEHRAFRLEKTSNKLLVKIVAKGRLLPGYFSLNFYEEALSKFQHKGKNWWDIFKDDIMHAVPVYNPRDERLWWFSENNHCFLNTYVRPDHSKMFPMTYEEADPLLRNFLEHLFVSKENVMQILKWCAYSSCQNLQTYLTLIGHPGIGKTIFVHDFLAFYHGAENFNLAARIENLHQGVSHQSTLIYLDEMVMNKTEHYNILKRFTNDLIAIDRGGKWESEATSRNFANLVWSSNTRENMGALTTEDRRFKIVKITDTPLNTIFSAEEIQNLRENPLFKNQFVGILLWILSKNEDTSDVNQVEDTYEKLEVLLASRSLEVKELFKLFFNIVNDFDMENKKPIRHEEFSDEIKETIGLPFIDYMPLTAFILPRAGGPYTLRIPMKILRLILDKKKTHEKFSLTYNRLRFHLMQISPKFCKIKHVNGTPNYDLEIYMPDVKQEYVDIIRLHGHRFSL